MLPPVLDRLPRVAPMLAVAGSLPTSEGWSFEMKWDGVRVIAYCVDGQLRLISRNDLDMTTAYPELAARLPDRTMIFDGEVVALDSSGRPSFSRLQKRMHVRDVPSAARLAVTDPVHLYVFDVLHLDGHSLLNEPHRVRRETLEGLTFEQAGWQVPPAFVGSGEDALRVSQEHGLEGVVAKRMESPYRPGRRSPDWTKVKNLRTQEVVVGGWTPGHGHRASTIGALLVGIPAAGGLQYAGKVGTGFTEPMLAHLLADLTSLSTSESPFQQVPRPDARVARWVKPELVGEVAFGEWTGERRVRHPVWRGLRPDKQPCDVVPES